MPNQENAAKAARRRVEQQPWYMVWLLAIPKNLVYFFVLIILAAFAAVCWIAYYEQDLEDFIAYDRTEEIVVVDPVFKQLQKTVPLDRLVIPALPSSQVSPGLVAREYVSQNRPLLISGYANDWAAT